MNAFSAPIDIIMIFPSKPVYVVISLTSFFLFWGTGV
jgi:hypothetical protein